MLPPRSMVRSYTVLFSATSAGPMVTTGRQHSRQITLSTARSAIRDRVWNTGLSILNRFFMPLRLFPEPRFLWGLLPWGHFLHQV